jgi:integrase/recombinase XerD
VVHQKRLLAKIIFMKKKPIRLQSSQYILLLQSFTEWLQILNYSEFSIPGLSRTLKEFFEYQEATGKLSLEQLTAADAINFIELKKAKGIYSSGHINKHIQSLKLFSKYIRETKRSEVAFNLCRMEDARKKPSWLTKEEIKQMYEAIPENILGIRDKAMMAVYYGCGLRLNEGANVEMKDINQTNKVLHVRKGKHYKERFVPIAEKNFEELKLYIDYARPQILQGNKTEALFLNTHNGKPIGRQMIYLRIKQLAIKADIKKRVGTHTLRHSIATHLLQSGMKLERIQQFLGHSNMDSTQIYTHLVNEETPNLKWKIKN